MIFFRCPTCGADRGQLCRTPKGRLKHDSVHDTRPFAITNEDFQRAEWTRLNEERD